MKLSRKIYLSNLAYLLLPFLSITLIIYLVGANLYHKLTNEQNLLYLNHLTRGLEREARFHQGDDNWEPNEGDVCLSNGIAMLFTQGKTVILGGEGYDLSAILETIKGMNLYKLEQGIRISDYYVYHGNNPIRNMNLLYLSPRNIADFSLNRFRYTLFLIFAGLLFLCLFVQKETTAATVEPIVKLYNTVWNQMDTDSQMFARCLGEDELTVVGNYLHRLQKQIKERDTKLNRNLFGMMDVLIGLLELKDSYTAAHSRQVRKYSIVIAKRLGLNEQEIRDIAFAATLHDIGKIGVSRNILNKPGKLTFAELSLIKKHPIIADEVLKNIEELKNIRKIIRHHHEKYDGSGYPDNLAYSDIPLAARIISVADAFDAMTSDRPYREAVGYDQAIKTLISEKGKQFDPQVVEVLIIYLAQQKLIQDVVTAK